VLLPHWSPLYSPWDETNIFKYVVSVGSLIDKTASPGMGDKVINREVDAFSLLDVPQSRDDEVVVKGIYAEGNRTKR